jgi:hypothetical protein
VQNDAKHRYADDSPVIAHALKRDTVQQGYDRLKRLDDEKIETARKQNSYPEQDDTKGSISEVLIPNNSVLREAQNITTIKDDETARRPRIFSNPRRLRDLVSLGPHFLTTQSGCRMARWFYYTDYSKIKYRDCLHAPISKRLTANTTARLEHGDTIYVTFMRLKDFVEQVLPLLSVDVVVISGQIQWIEPSTINTTAHTASLALVDNVHILHWFCQNLPIYGGADLYHPKISPFPYGLKEVAHLPKKNAGLAFYKEIFLETLSANNNRTTEEASKGDTFIYAGYLRPLPSRSAIPSSNAHLTPREFYSKLSRATYILSPNGDRPECYRHYEALGLGVIPITELDPWSFRHLQEGPIVYGNSEWNLTRLELRLSPAPDLVVNRNLILEEYWMEYMDWTAETSLNWWDERRQGSTTFRELVAELPSQIKTSIPD